MSKKVKDAELRPNNLFLEIGREKDRYLVAEWVTMIYLNITGDFESRCSACDKTLQGQLIRNQFGDFIMDLFPIVFDFFYIICKHLLVSLAMHVFCDLS